MDYYNNLTQKEKDILRIQKVLLRNGIDKTSDECKKLWHRYSQKVWHAVWEGLPENNKTLFEILKQFIDNPNKKQKWYTDAYFRNYYKK